MLKQLKDFKISKQDMPELLYAERRQLQIERYEAYCASLTGEDKVKYEQLQAERAAEAEKKYEREERRINRWYKKHQREMAEEEKQLKLDIENLKLKDEWPGTKRVARWIQNRLEKSCVEFHRVDAMTGSIYFYTGDDKLRVSDHEQPEGGAWNHELGYRAGEPTVNVTPRDADWRKAASEVVENEMAIY